MKWSPFHLRDTEPAGFLSRRVETMKKFKEEVRIARVNATSSRASSGVPTTMHPANFSRTSRFRKSTFIQNIYRGYCGRATCNPPCKILNFYIFFQCTQFLHAYYLYWTYNYDTRNYNLLL